MLVTSIQDENWEVASPELRISDEGIANLLRCMNYFLVKLFKLVASKHDKEGIAKLLRAYP